MAMGVQTDVSLLIRYMAELKAKGQIVREKGVQAGPRLLVGVPSAKRNEKEEMKEASRKQ